jgi:hypothetical protein
LPCRKRAAGQNLAPVSSKKTSRVGCTVGECCDDGPARPASLLWVTHRQPSCNSDSNPPSPLIRWPSVMYRAPCSAILHAI